MFGFVSIDVADELGSISYCRLRRTCFGVVEQIEARLQLPSFFIGYWCSHDLKQLPGFLMRSELGLSCFRDAVQ